MKNLEVRMGNAYCEKHKRFHFPCPCTDERDREIAEKNRADERDREREERLRLWQFCRVAPEYYTAALDNYEPQNESQQRALALVNALVSEYKQRSRVHGDEYESPKHSKLIISGHNGLGKTHLAAAAVKALRGQLWTMFEIGLMIRASYSQKSAETEWEIIEKLAQLPLLAIDEIGRSKGQDADLNWLSTIVNKRHEQGLPIILLTNKPFRRDCRDGSCLEDYVGTDIISRFRDGGARVTLMGDDYRSVLGSQKRQAT